MTITAGSRLGPYEIVAPIGAGAMGEVWRARDTRLGREVAVKVLPASFASNADRLQRFEQEARAAGSINHPNLVTVHDIGTHDGAPYIVMELLDGQTLRDRIEGNGGGIAPRKAIDYSIQIAGGLAAAHEKGVVHRDLKPENVFVTRDGRVKILDFGLAKLRIPGDQSDTTAATQARGTEPGTVMGTAGYMSPEQVRGQDVDHRTDIFAFGAILYEMLAGRRAFHGPSSVETMNAILKEDPPEVSSDGGRMTPALDRVIRRCLEKNREERFHSAHDVAFALEAVTSGSTTSGPQIAAAPRRRKLGAAAMVAALLLAVALGWGAARMMTRATPPLERHLTQLTFDPGVESEPSISPDGKQVAYVAQHEGNRDIYVLRVGGTNAINLTKDSAFHDDEPAFSPDGQQIAFHSERQGGGIFVMGATGESVRRLCDFGFNPAWSPDGKWLIISTERIVDPLARLLNAQLWRVNVETAERTRFYDGDGVQPAWSPGGQRVAFWSVNNGRRMIRSIAAGGGKPNIVIDDGAMNWSPFWSPDGKFLFYCTDRGGTMNVWRVPIDERSGVVRGAPEQITMATDWTSASSITRDGKTIAFATRRGEGQLYGVPFDPVKLAFTGPPESLVRGSRRLMRGDISPDGKFIAFNNIGVQEDIYIARRDGGEVRQLTNDPFKDRQPRWSPDGSRLVFYSNRGGGFELWTIAADGGSLQQLTHDFRMVEPLWSRDGRTIVGYDTGRRTGGAIDPAGVRAPALLPRPTPNEGFWPTSFSPDDTRLAGVVTDRFGQWSRNAILDLRTQTFTKISDAPTGPVWLDDTTLLVQIGDRVVAYDTRSRTTRDVGPLPNSAAFLNKLGLSPDRRLVFYNSSATESDVWLVTLSQ